MQIYKMQRQRIARLPLSPIPILDQKMAQVKVAVIHSIPVDGSTDDCHLTQQFMFQPNTLIGRQLSPIVGQLF